MKSEGWTMISDLISRKELLKEIESLYDLNYGERLINPMEFYDMVDCQPSAFMEVRQLIQLMQRK